MATDVEITRTLNALAVTLDDQKADRLDVARCQAIVTGALGGEPHLTVHAADRTAGWLADESGERVAELRLERGRWTTERLQQPWRGRHPNDPGSAGPADVG